MTQNTRYINQYTVLNSSLIFKKKIKLYALCMSYKSGFKSLNKAGQIKCTFQKSIKFITPLDIIFCKKWYNICVVKLYFKKNINT